MSHEIDSPARVEITGRIRVVRGQRVILDSDLAMLYGVETREFNQAVRRNAARFPMDFMFQLTNQEFATLRSQIVTSRDGRGGRQFAPYAFTEHGAIMAAGILNSSRAIEVSVFVVRAFVELRNLFATHKELAKRLDDLEARIEKEMLVHDAALARILAAIRTLTKTSESRSRPIGFVTNDEST